MVTGGCTKKNQEEAVEEEAKVSSKIQQNDGSNSYTQRHLACSHTPATKEATQGSNECILQQRWLIDLPIRQQPQGDAANYTSKFIEG
jgi:hypothetical protein